MRSLLLAFLLSGCLLKPEPTPTPVPGPVDPDAGTCEAAMGDDPCGLAALQVWCVLRCPGYEGSKGRDRVWGTSDDDTFADACRVIEFDTFCLQSATNCEDANACR